MLNRLIIQVDLLSLRPSCLEVFTSEQTSHGYPGDVFRINEPTSPQQSVGV
jgi:hypothetical protein